MSEFPKKPEIPGARDPSEDVIPVNLSPFEKKKKKKQPTMKKTPSSGSVGSKSKSGKSKKSRTASNQKLESAQPVSPFKQALIENRHKILLLIIGILIVILVCVQVKSNKDKDNDNDNTEDGSLSIVLEEPDFDKYEPKPKQGKLEDEFFVEPESKIIPTPHNIPEGTTPVDGNTVVFCHVISPSPLEENNNDHIIWDMHGQELTHAIKHSANENTNNTSSAFNEHYGYGHKIAMSGDGRTMAVCYEGMAGFDHAFGIHIDIYTFNATGSWNIQQTVTDVTRFHGHKDDLKVAYTSLTISTNGNIIMFSDGHHGVSVYEYSYQQEIWYSLDRLHYNEDDRENDNTINGRNLRGLSTSDSTSNTVDDGHQFGTNVASNCDGSIIAISGTTNTYSFTMIYYREKQNNNTDRPKYMEMVEIQNVKHGGEIALNAAGDRIAIGTIASQQWKGIVQVYDYDYDTSEWKHIGQPIVGQKEMEMWGGQVVMSADGSTVVATSKHGSTNRVAAYRLVEEKEIGTGKSILMWRPFGGEITGTGDVYEHYGSDISINYDGTILAVGAPGDYDLYIKQQNGLPVSAEHAPFVAGSIYMYRIFESGYGKHTWNRIDTGELKNIKDGDLFGTSISISLDGLIIAGGAPQRKGKSYQHILGSVHAYKASISE